jgi:hypothetical protein
MVELDMFLTGVQATYRSSDTITGTGCRCNSLVWSLGVV